MKHPYPLRVGSHMGISGGFARVPKETVEEVGGNAFQIFNHSPRFWKVRDPEPADVELFRQQMLHFGIQPQDALVHSSYLINLAGPKQEVYEQSIDLMIREVQICDRLSLPYLNVHPGSHLGTGEALGIERVRDALHRIFEATPNSPVMILLEGVSQKGGNIGYRIPQIGTIIDQVDPQYRPRLGYCYDTCHGFDSGYDITTPDGVKELMAELDGHLGWDLLKMIHLNDSKYPLGANKDRHENIGKGTIGIDGFSHFFSYPEFHSVPWLLETPGDNADHHQDLMLIREIMHRIDPSDIWDWRIAVDH